MDEPGKVAMWCAEDGVLMGLMDHDVIEYEGKFVPVVKMTAHSALEIAQILIKQAAATIKETT